MSDPETMLALPKNSVLRREDSAVGENQKQLSQRELFLLVLVSAILFIATVSAHVSWLRSGMAFGDNAPYLAVAAAIQHWNFHGLDIQHFMGYPYLIAVTSSLFHIPLPIALYLVSWVSSLTAIYFTARLYGTWVAAYFALSNFAWLQRSFLGGAEPLAVALGMIAFWMFRRERVLQAALLASLATVVRPAMVAALIGIGLSLLYRKKYAQFLFAVAISLVIGGLYVTPLLLYFGDPLLTVHSYIRRDFGAAANPGPHGHLFGWPFHGMVVGTMTYPAPITNLALSLVWILLVLAGIGMMFSRRFREYAKTYPAEAIYCGISLVVLFCYDYLEYARSNFIRFAIPVLPIIFYALLDWLPKNRFVIWALCLVSSVLAAFSAIGIRNVSLH
jgi:hypothetical protein